MSQQAPDLDEKKQERFAEMVRSGVGIVKLSQAFGIGCTVARRFRDDVLRREGSVPNQKNLKAACAEAERANLEAWIKDHVKPQWIAQLRKRGQVRKWKAPIDGPIAIAVPADIHGGSKHVDYEALMRDLKVIRDTEGMYCITGGDAIDNHIKHIAAIIASRITPGEQWEFFRLLLTYLKDKLIGVVGGNHEAWTTILAGYDPQRSMTELMGVMYDPNQMMIDVQVGKQSYRGMVRHKFRFNSSFNPEHSVRRMYDMQAHFDFGVVCDKHEATVAPFVRDGIRRWVGRPGSYQICSEFSEAIGFHDAHPITPAFVFYPDERKFHGFETVEWAALALKAARADWKRRKK